MSHVAVQQTKPGEPMFADLEALKMACDMLGLEIEVRSNYAWFNRHMGDYPLPAGMKANELGNNAKFVVKLTEATASKRADTSHIPYEIGMVEDPNNPGCYTPIYDFWAGGYGLEETVGAPLFEGKDTRKVQMLCPKLKQFYDMCCDKLAAQQAGDNIQFLTAKDAHEKYPLLFPNPTNDVDTWVSIADTENRIRSSI